MGVLVIHVRSQKRGARQKSRSRKTSPGNEVQETEEGEEVWRSWCCERSAYYNCHDTATPSRTKARTGSRRTRKIGGGSFQAQGHGISFQGKYRGAGTTD